MQESILNETTDTEKYWCVIRLTDKDGNITYRCDEHDTPFCKELINAKQYEYFLEDELEASMQSFSYGLDLNNFKIEIKKIRIKYEIIEF